MRNPSLSILSIAVAVVFSAGCAQNTSSKQDANMTQEPNNALEADKQHLERRDFSGPPAQETAANASMAAKPLKKEKDLQGIANARGRTEAQRSVAPVQPAPFEKAAVVGSAIAQSPPMPTMDAEMAESTLPANTENYATQSDNPVVKTAEIPISTFSIDVDTGSYTNVRRMLNQGMLPPADSVRAEEFINYFDYGYPAPTSLETPFSVTTEIAQAPWNADRHLLLVGIKGYEVDKQTIPAANLVFLIDTSGSMQDTNKLPLLKEAFKLIVPGLREQDRVSIVVYAGSAGLILPPTPGNRQEEILAALERLEAGGSTNGAQGIELAYGMAEKTFIKNGVNRVILATDGDFNVGTVDVEALKTMVADRRESGISLTTLGFGQGNYNDEMAEQLADIGNGNHFYIDTLNEGHKVMVEEMSANLMTIAKDVKIQIEFNPALVAEYRLIGYENRQLRREDFNNDKIDAGEIGAGHDVTALYELTLVGSKSAQIDPLRYGEKPAAAATVRGDELAFLRLRYKQPNAQKSKLIERTVVKSQIRSEGSDRLQYAAAVAAFADALQGGTHLANFDLAKIGALAKSHLGKDSFGYGRELVDLIDKAQAMQTPREAEQANLAD